MIGAATDVPTEPTIREVRRSEKSVELALLAPRSMLYFSGHFPGHPILPGVVQVDWAIRLARRFLSLEKAAARSIQVKFRKPMPPETAMVLALAIDAGGRLAFEYRDGEGICSSGRIGF
ncbi:MAG TPA: hypothetical protein VE397_03445 [Stellaceae bacterium]|jgi:3-hydroxymyristoyl/3-hydroxydecanoyl-(acyl carrier protein) dehydratase|nr:hypothetical protein [Stellaceae bacterium]